jgi:hypothetical protein
MLDGVKTLVVLRSVNQQLTRWNDLYERHLSYERARLLMQGVVLDAPPHPPMPQDSQDLYASAPDLLQFDQERKAYAQQLGREPTDEEVLDWISQRDRR